MTGDESFRALGSEFQATADSTAMVYSGAALDGGKTQRLVIAKPADSHAGQERSDSAIWSLPAKSTGGLKGLSGLTRDPRGRYWTVAERDNALLPMDWREGSPVFGEPVPIEGIPEGLEAESLSWISGDSFIIGTESRVRDRQADRLLFGRLVDGGAKITAALDVNWRQLWGMKPWRNQGFEAVAMSQGRVVVIGETVRKAQHKRWAPVAITDGGGWKTFWIELSSDDGKISAAAVRTTFSGVEIFAIERHFGIKRILRVALPRNLSQHARLAPELFYDLKDHEDHNYEGLDFLDDGSLMLISDNSFRNSVKETAVLVLRTPQ